MDNLLSTVWHTGNADIFAQIFHLIISENLSGKCADINVYLLKFAAQILYTLKFNPYTRGSTSVV